MVRVLKIYGLIFSLFLGLSANAAYIPPSVGTFQCGGATLLIATYPIILLGDVQTSSRKSTFIRSSAAAGYLTGATMTCDCVVVISGSTTAATQFYIAQ